jgi:hypothetical protein
MPQYRSKHWDGKIRLFSTHNGEIYVGLLDKIISWAKNHQYSIEFENNKSCLILACIDLFQNSTIRNLMIEISACVK